MGARQPVGRRLNRGRHAVGERAATGRSRASRCCDVRAQGRSTVRPPSILNSSNDIGGQLVFDRVDAITQLQLSLFQSLNLKQIRPGRALQSLNRGIKIAVFLSEARELCSELRL